MEAHTLVGEFKICCLNIFYQYNGVLTVLVVESCPSVVACGQCRGVPPQRWQSCDVRCTKGILLIIRYQYHIVSGEKCTYTLHHTSLTQMPFLIAEVVGACQAAHGFRVFGSGFVNQVNVKHNRLSFVTVVIELLHGHGLGR